MRPLLILQPDPRRPPGFIADLLARADWPTVTVRIERSRLDALGVLARDCAGLIVLDDSLLAGLPDDASAPPASALDRELVQPLLAQAWAAGAGLCGIGSGAASLARARGAAPSGAARELGWFPATLRPAAASGAWLARLGTSSRHVMLWQGHAWSAPPDTEALLATPQSPCIVWAAPRLLGLHFHADLGTASYAEALPTLRAALPAAGISVQSAAEFTEGFARHAAAMRDLTTRLVQHWLGTLTR